MRVGGLRNLLLVLGEDQGVQGEKQAENYIRTEASGKWCYSSEGTGSLNCNMWVMNVSFKGLSVPGESLQYFCVCLVSLRIR